MKTRKKNDSFYTILPIMYQNVQIRPFSLAQFKKISYLCTATGKNSNNIQ